MSAALPARPNLAHLKKQAKALLEALQQQDPIAIGRVRALGIAIARPKLADAQHVIAREYGFPTWATLKERVDLLASAIDPRKAFRDVVQAKDVGRARDLLQRYPELRGTLDKPAAEIPFGGTPIGHVAGTQHREMIDLFLEYGADVNARSDWWAGSFGVLDSGDHEFASFLISRGARVDAHAAARLGRLDTLRELVTANPDVVHARGGDGQTPLHFASSIEIADYLLEHGAAIDVLDVDHEGTPAQWMIGDRTELARHLVTRGARTDILMAVALGDLDLVRKYLDEDPTSVRTTVSAEYFPMRDPRAGGHIYMWSLGRNKTAHEIARDFGHEEIWRLLMDRSSDDVRLVEACRLGDERLVRELVGKHPEPSRTLPNEERRKLVDAAQDENTTAVRLMLAAGWPTDGRGQDNGTALHWAAFLGNAEMVRELLRHGASVDVKGDAHDSTPLGWGIYGSTNSWRCTTGDYSSTVKALLDAGAQVPAVVEAASRPVREVLRRYRERKAAP